MTDWETKRRQELEFTLRDTIYTISKHGIFEVLTKSDYINYIIAIESELTIIPSE